MGETWSDRAWRVIDAVHQALPPDAAFADRQKALREAYPFGERAHHPYKAWCAAQRRYLARYSPKPAGPLFARPALSSTET